MSESEGVNISYYVSLLSGALLAVSEILPYLTKVKGNGIIQILMNAYGEQKKQEEEKEHQENKKLDEILARLEKLENIVQVKPTDN
jgi:predicted CopG family antitoxin